LFGRKITLVLSDFADPPKSYNCCRLHTGEDRTADILGN
jgi:hypothetical protein